MANRATEFKEKMISMSRNRIDIFTFACAFVSLFCGCNHKELVWPGDAQSVVEVVFDWQKDPEADPAGMTVIFFPDDNGEIYRFDIAGKDGGPVKLPPGNYNVIAYNSDSYNQLFGNTSYFLTMYAYTQEYTSPLFKSNEPTRAMPQMMWSAAVENIRIDDSCCCRSGDSGQTIYLLPSPLNADYKFVGDDIFNLDNVRATVATLGGMAWAVTLHDQRLYDNPADLPFMPERTGPHSIESVFNPFGDSSATKGRNILTLYFLLKDNRQVAYKYDVTNQIDTASNPRNVTIRIKGIDLPDVNPADTVGNSGLVVNVDGWEVVNVNV